MKSILFSIMLFVLLAAASTISIQAKEKSSRALISTTVVINEIYGGGGSATATYQRDYIELKNISLTLQDISGWSVQYASATGTTWTVTAIPANTILRPGDFYLVAGASGAGLNPLPAFNVAGTISASNTAGKVALVSNSVALTGNGCPIASPIVDFVGYGATANCFEGAVAPSPTNTTSSLNRTAGLDTDSNSADFSNAAPTPQVAVQATAANASIGGRVLSSDGRGISKVTVTLVDGSGTARNSITNGFGYYTFDDLGTGQTYTLSVRNKRYTFNPSTRVVSLVDNIADADFTAEP